MGKAVKREGRVERFLMGLPLRRALVVYVVVYLLASLPLIAGTMALCDRVRERVVYNATAEIIDENEMVVRVSYALINAAVTTSKDDVTYRLILRAEDEPLYTICGIVEMLSVVAWPLFALSLAARRFYRRKLRAPLGILQSAARRIGQNDLDFSIDYDAPDELGRLCRDFEQMRESVLGHERELWRAMEERRRQTDALTHDLRTPLTVLKGQAEMLEAAAETDKARRTLGTMREHILRMERYVAGLGEMRSLEDAAARPEAVSADALLRTIRDTGDALSREAGKAFVLRADGLPETLTIDAQMVQRVLDNLLGNAMRYAAERVEVTLGVSDGRLALTVCDDGLGFSRQALLHATAPFWSEEKTGTQGHLGLGLNIAALLCERCGGSLALDRGPEGGARATATFRTGAARD